MEPKNIPYDCNEHKPYDCNENKEPFKLTVDILTAYPELKDLGDYLYDAGDEARNARIKTIPQTISAIFQNLRTVEDCLPDVEKGVPTVNIFYELDVAQTGLSELMNHLAEYKFCRPDDSAPKYAPFMEAERQRFIKLRERAFAVIGDKVRRDDGVYE